MAVLLTDQVAVCGGMVIGDLVVAVFDDIFEIHIEGPC